MNEMTTNLGTAVVLALLLTQHVAAEPKVITLSCDGMETLLEEATETPLRNVSVVVNLDERQVSFANYVASITDIDATNIAFSGRRTEDWFSGDINRLTGDMQMTVFVSIKEEVRSRYLFDLRCKATERLTKRSKLHAAIAVMLDLVEPEGAVRRGLHPRRQARVRIPMKSPGCTDLKSPRDSETMSPTFPI